LAWTTVCSPGAKGGLSITNNQFSIFKRNLPHPLSLPLGRSPVTAARKPLIELVPFLFLRLAPREDQSHRKRKRKRKRRRMRKI
jgi:hypothetical protein